MTIRLHRGQVRWFRSKAKKNYPLEIQALLIGQRLSPNLVGVSYFVYPPQIQTVDWVEVPNTVYEETAELVNDDGLKIVGTLHSHCDALPMMSQQDKRSHIAAGDAVSGILTVLSSGNTHLEFWKENDCLPLNIEYY
jgi:proteasome lid subunit RPN8/RPN11